MQSICVRTIVILGFLFPATEASCGTEKSSAQITLQRASHIASTIKKEDKSVVLQEIVSAQVKANDILGAIKTASSIPNAVTRSNALATIASAQARLGDIRGAEETTAGIEHELARSGPLSAIAVAYAKVSDFQKAVHVIRTIPDNYAARDDAFRNVAKQLAAGGDIQGALSLVTEVMDHNPYAIWEILKTKTTTGDIKEAVQIANSISNIYHRGYALWGITADIPDVQTALEIAADIPMGHARASALYGIAERQLAQHDVQGSLRTLNMARQAIPSVQNVWAKADIQWRIAKAFAKAGDINTAQSIAIAIKKEGHRANALRDIIAEVAKSGEYDRALNMDTSLENTGDFTFTDFALSSIAEVQVRREGLKKALDTVGKIHHHEPKGVALIKIADAEIEGGHIDGALQTIDALKKEGGEEFGFFVAHAFADIALARARVGIIQEALGFSTLIEREFERRQSLKAIAQIQTEAGDEHGALEWTNKLESPLEASTAVIGVAYGLLSKHKQ